MFQVNYLCQLRPQRGADRVFVTWRERWGHTIHASLPDLHSPSVASLGDCPAEAQMEEPIAEPCSSPIVSLIVFSLTGLSVPSGPTHPLVPYCSVPASLFVSSSPTGPPRPLGQMGQTCSTSPLNCHPAPWGLEDSPDAPFFIRHTSVPVSVLFCLCFTLACTPYCLLHCLHCISACLLWGGMFCLSLSVSSAP